jgi:hypothetical protein
MADHDLYMGTDAFTGRQYLLTIWHSGGAEIAVRDEEWHTWSPPITVEPIPAEVGA